MNKIYIVPLAMPDSITFTAYNAIMSAQKNGIRLYIQTEKHPAANFIIQNRIPHETMDDLYETVYDFDELNQAIANRLICGADVIYAVCGRGVATPLMKCIEVNASANDISIEILPSSGYAEAAAAACRFSLSGGTICAANDIPSDINVYSPLCVEEIDNVITAGEVKLKLSEFYPDDSDIIFAYTDDEGKYYTRTIKLYELDRQKEYFAATLVLIRAFTFMELDRYGTQGVEEITRILRAPDGCPWDIKQTHQTLKTALIEESYEVLDAINTDDMDALCEELGDLFLQIVFHAQLETEKASFTMRDVCTGVVKKLIFRHPHVFGNKDGINTPDDVLKAWDELKKEEKKQSTQSDALRAVPNSFPALMRSAKIQKRAADVGFDWDNAMAAMYKIDEEKSEVIAAIESDDREQIFEEVGDLLFAVVNVSRLLKIDPELALRESADKFMNRFCKMEELIIADGKNCKNMSLDEMDLYWDKCKKLITDVKA